METKIKELSFEEMLLINGGDAFMQDLGNACGSIAHSIWNGVTWFVSGSSSSGGSGYAYAKTGM